MITTIIISAIVIALGAYLWHLGGQGVWWARNIVGGIIGAGKAILLGNPLALLYWPALWALTKLFSYGLSAPPHKFWVWVFGKGESGDYLPVEIATRATCGFAWSLAGLVFMFLTGNWVNQIIYTVLATIGVTLFGLHKKVEVSELGTGATVSTSVLI